MLVGHAVLLTEDALEVMQPSGFPSSWASIRPTIYSKAGNDHSDPETPIHPIIRAVVSEREAKEGTLWGVEMGCSIGTEHDVTVKAEQVQEVIHGAAAFSG